MDASPHAPAETNMKCEYKMKKNTKKVNSQSAQLILLSNYYLYLHIVLMMTPYANIRWC